jgi:tRNA 2-thiouridine synthesizing protein A
MILQTNATLDARGLSCPLPILRTRKALSALDTGQTLKVIATDPGSVKDIGSFCAQTSDELIENIGDGNEFTFIIRKS